MVIEVDRAPYRFKLEILVIPPFGLVGCLVFGVSGSPDH
jgi:hypothetical protein